MIYTVTLNPALDYVLRVEDFSEGMTHRAHAAKLLFGGKGINVSTVLTRLGMPTVAMGFVAGFTGDALCAHLAEAGVTQDMIRLEQGMTRINVKLKTNRETEINGNGPNISPEAMAVLMKKLESATDGDTLVLAGSIPSTLPSDTYAQMLDGLKGKEIRVVVDTAGEALMRVLPHRPFLVKPNLQELSDVVGRALGSDEDVLHAAEELQKQGAVNVLVSLGRGGALLLDEYGMCHRAPAVGGKPVNTVGAGDSMVAGFLAGLPQGYGYALRLGLAAGGATACAEGLATEEAINELMAHA